VTLPARSLRRGEPPWTLAQRAKNDAIYVAVRAALGACALVPAAALRALGRGLGRAAYALLGRARRTALANLALARPELSEEARRELAWRAFVTLGAHLADAVAMLRGDDPAPLVFDAADRAILESAREEGRGVLFASAHLGPWERVAATLVRAGVPLVTLAREAYDPRLTWIYDRLRAPRGVAAIYRGHPGAAARIVRALKTGAVLGMPMDLRSRVPSIEAPFLGHPASTAVGPARIALRTGAPVVVGTYAPGDRVTVTRIPTDDLVAGPEGEARLTERLNGALSARILAAPEAWVWMHERFASGGESGNFRNKSRNHAYT
jgi:KDO2-lipid IV(A) lauroyltransferase